MLNYFHFSKPAQAAGSPDILAIVTVSGDTRVSILTNTRRALGWSLLAALVLGFVWPLIEIQLRLSRNGAVAQRLVLSLEDRFPGVQFQGGASYKDEVVSIVVRNHLDEADRKSLETWLRLQKADQKIRPRILLRFDDEDQPVQVD